MWTLRGGTMGTPNGGSLLFVYPTKKGASTFKSQYLGPILDPLLRLAEVSAHVCGQLIHHNELAEKRVEDGAQILGFEG
jgi:hypothetical protein